MSHSKRSRSSAFRSTEESPMRSPTRILSSARAAGGLGLVLVALQLAVGCTTAAGPADEDLWNLVPQFPETPYDRIAPEVVASSFESSDALYEAVSRAVAPAPPPDGLVDDAYAGRSFVFDGREVRLHVRSLVAAPFDALGLIEYRAAVDSAEIRWVELFVPSQAAVPDDLGPLGATFPDGLYRFLVWDDETGQYDVMTPEEFAAEHQRTLTLGDGGVGGAPAPLLSCNDGSRLCSFLVGLLLDLLSGRGCLLGSVQVGARVAAMCGMTPVSAVACFGVATALTYIACDYLRSVATGVVVDLACQVVWQCAAGRLTGCSCPFSSDPCAGGAALLSSACSNAVSYGVCDLIDAVYRAFSGSPRLRRIGAVERVLRDLGFSAAAISFATELCDGLAGRNADILWCEEWGASFCSGTGCSCTDADGDGHLARECVDSACSPRDDCDDANAAVYPGAAERCDGIVDDDCDGIVDEGCSCTGASTQSCGRCGTQSRTCTTGSWSAWSTCSGEGACTPGETQSCGTGGVRTCASDCSWGTCMECSGSSTQSCGRCGTRSRTCTAGVWSAWSTCAGEGVCSPGETQTCSGTGTQTCTASCTWGSCVGGCPCSTGPCCDGCNFRPTSYLCGASVAIQYTCAAGTGCGADAYVREQHQYCSASSAACDGPLLWTTPSVVDDCTATERCAEGDSSCNPDASCTVCSPYYTDELSVSYPAQTCVDNNIVRSSPEINVYLGGASPGCGVTVSADGARIRIVHDASATPTPTTWNVQMQSVGSRPEALHVALTGYFSAGVRLRAQFAPSVGPWVDVPADSTTLRLPVPAGSTSSTLVIHFENLSTNDRIELDRVEVYPCP